MEARKLGRFKVRKIRRPVNPFMLKCKYNRSYYLRKLEYVFPWDINNQKLSPYIRLLNLYRPFNQGICQRTKYSAIGYKCFKKRIFTNWYKRHKQTRNGAIKFKDNALKNK